MQQELFNNWKREAEYRDHEVLRGWQGEASGASPSAKLEQKVFSIFRGFAVTLTAEKILLLAMANLVGLVLVFSFGVERGVKVAHQALPALNEPVKVVQVSQLPEALPFEKAAPIAKEPFWNGMLKSFAARTQKQFSEAKDVVTLKVVEPIQKVAEEAVEKRQAAMVLEQQAEDAQSPEVSTPKAPETAKSDGRFTIQLITYVTQARADKEVKSLTEKGHRAFIIPSGKYFQVCVDRFGHKQDASLHLGTLNRRGYAKHYEGAYVRMVST